MLKHGPLIMCLFPPLNTIKILSLNLYRQVNQCGGSAMSLTEETIYSKSLGLLQNLYECWCRFDNYHHRLGHRRLENCAEVKQSLLIVSKDHFLFRGIKKQGFAYSRLLKAKKKHYYNDVKPLLSHNTNQMP